MQLTTHARIRAQQRAIPALLIDLLLQFGSRESAPGGVGKVYFDKPARRRLKAYAGPIASLLDEHLDLYAVVADDSKVVTVGYRTGRMFRH